MKLNKQQIAYLCSIGLAEGATMAQVREFVRGLTGDQRARLEGMAGDDDAGQPAPGGGDGGSGGDVAGGTGPTRKQLQALARMAGLTGEEADVFIAEQGLSGASLADARQAAMAAFAANRPSMRQSVSVGDEPRDRAGRAIEDAIALRSGARIERPAAEANRMRDMRLVDMAREHLRACGITPRNDSAVGIAEMVMGGYSLGHTPYGHTTSDFANVLGNALGKSLRSSYDEAPSTWERWAGRNTARDFKEVKRVALSGAPTPPKVLEAAEYTMAYMGETAEVYSLAKYGEKFFFTFEMLINDDLAAFAQLTRAFGLASKRLENDLAYAPITGNQTMTETGQTLFHADHGNLASDSGEVGAPSLSLISAGRQKIALQTGPAPTSGDTGPDLNLTVAALLCPVELEDTARQLVASTVDPTKSNQTPNLPWLRELEVVGEPRLSRDSAAAWYLAAPVGQIDTVEVCFLNGYERPTILAERQFSPDGVSYVLRHICAARAIDYRGLFKNNGE